jgi:hypothetical protein
MGEGKKHITNTEFFKDEQFNPAWMKKGNLVEVIAPEWSCV